MSLFIQPKALNAQIEFLINRVNANYSFGDQQPIQLKIIYTPLGFYIAGVFKQQICCLDIIHSVKTKLTFNKLASYYQTKLYLIVNDHIINELEKQLTDYFAKKLVLFSIPTLLAGTEFQKKVWNFLTTIPYGTTVSYKQQALALNIPTAIRAVANANGKNPVSILIPCHRVIGSNGSLTGYACGLDIKKKLLELEQKHF